MGIVIKVWMRKIRMKNNILSFIKVVWIIINEYFPINDLFLELLGEEETNIINKKKIIGGIIIIGIGVIIYYFISDPQLFSEELYPTDTLTSNTTRILNFCLRYCYIYFTMENKSWDKDEDEN